MVETHHDFVKRLKLLGRKHDKMTNGYTTRVGKDGLIVIKPKRARNTAPLKYMMFLLAGFISFKAVMLATMGPVTYNERLSILERGNIVELAGAKALAIDPVTEIIAGLAGSLNLN